MTAPKPYTVPNLAARWECSEGLVRKMIERGELSSFRLGTLIRIPAAEVAKIECHTASNDSEADLHLSGKRTANEDDAPFTPQIGRARKPRPAASGKQATILHGRWDA